MGKTPKSGTESSRKRYKFISFREKVDSIRIDPIRRVNRKITDYKDQSSYFITSFENWSELNLSAGFTEFSLQCNQYCGSLPLILHHQQEIFDLLISHIEHRDENSLESLLDLVTHFAHDLGPDFHPYFKKTLQVVMSLISSSSIEIVQWSFNCLAYLFKFLSRLLTTDLRPTYDEISPLLGEAYHKKQHINRFAAESLAFLVRKCPNSSLVDIIEHIVNQISNQQSDQFVNSIVLLFTESIQSSGSSIHSKGPEIFRFLISCVLSHGPNDYLTRLVSRILSDILHHTQKEDAKIIYSVILEFGDEFKSIEEIEFYLILLNNMAGHRKGSRVYDWTSLFEKSIEILKKTTNYKPLDKKSSILICCLAYFLMEYSDFEIRTKYFSNLLHLIFDITGNHCLIFCEIIIRKDPKMFFEYIYPFFKQYVIDSNTFDVTERALFLVNLFRTSKDSKLSLVTKSDIFKNAENSLSNDIKNQQTQDLCWKVSLLRYTSVDEHLLKNIYQIIRQWNSFSKDKSTSAIILGDLYSIIASNCKNPKDLVDIYDVIVSHIGIYNSANYLEGFEKLTLGLEKSKQRLSQTTLNTIFHQLLPFCRCPSQHLRRLAIGSLNSLYRLHHHNISQPILNILNNSVNIESISRDVSNSRNLQLQIRNLGIAYSTIGTDAWIDESLTNHLFGLFSDRFQPCWQAALESIQEIAKKSPNEVSNVLLSFLNETAFQAPLRVSSIHMNDKPMEKCSTCSNVIQLIDETMEIYENYESPLNSIVFTLQSDDDFHFEHITQRSLALKALENLSSIAQKHNEYLIAHFLQLSKDDSDENSETWAWKDRLSLLRILSLFRDQQKLPMADKLHERYLYLLANRSVEVQKLALKCLSAFKKTKLKKYSDDLRTLLDDTQFKDALVNVLNISDDEAVIHEKDRDDIFPYIVRILFGRVQGTRSSGSKQGQIFAIISSLQNLTSKYINTFVEIAVERLECKGFVKIDNNKAVLNPTMTSKESMDQRKELGFVSLLENMVNILGSQLNYSMEVIMNALIFCMIHANTSSSTSKSIRASCFKCLSELVRVLPQFNWSSYFDLLFDIFVRPRLDQFQQDNSQQPSSLMLFLRNVSEVPSFAYFLTFDDCIVIKKVLELPSSDIVKDSSIECLLDIILNVMSLNDTCDPKTFSTICNTLVPLTLKQIPVLLERPVNHVLLEKESQILVTILEKDYSVDSNSQMALISASLKALSKPVNEVRIDTKTIILQAFSKLVSYDSFSDEIASQVGETLSPLFKTFRDRKARKELANVFVMLGSKFAKYDRIGRLILQLNSYSTKRLDTLNFDERLKAYSEINEQLWNELSSEEWIPLLYNMLYFIRDPDELALRTNSVYSLKRFVDCKVSHENDSSLSDILQDLILKEIRLGLRNDNELLRVQYVDILHYIVQKNASQEVVDMSCLLFNGDEEADFFNNICHIQMHRRQRTINRLAIMADQCQLTDTSIAHYLMPILEHYISGKQGYSHWLAEESVKAIGSLSRHLSWNQYRAILKRYVAHLSRNEGSIKTNIRLIDAMATSAMDSYAEKLTGEAKKSENSVKGSVILSENFPKSEKLNMFVTDDLSPSLLKLLEKVDDNEEIIMRVEITVPLIKFMKLLEEEKLQMKLPGVLSKVSQILRSKAQDVRDAARNALCKAASILGPEYLVFVIRELKSVLRRGAQLHVLGYTVHTLLVELQTHLKHGDVNDSSQLIGEIIMEDVFGVTGEEKDEEGYISKMREVKQQKSYDTGQLTSKWISLSHFNNLMNPVQKMLLYDRINNKVEHKMEELLRRYSLGLQENSESDTRNVLVLCYEIFASVEKAEADREKQIKEAQERNDYANMKNLQAKEAEEFFTVELDSRNWKSKSVLHPENLHVVVKFVLDSLRSVFGKHDKLLTVENVAEFIPIARKALDSGFENVEISAMRLLSLLIPLPLTEIRDSLTFFGRKAIEFIEASTDTNSELCQASLRLLSVLIRQKSEFAVKESMISYILNRVQSDIEEPGKQGITFTFIKAVLSRKIIVNEVYDLMDHVAKAMVTNQTAIIRNACRSAYFMFLTDYPQGSARLSKQMSFLVANLEYPSKAGRLSVMELMHLLISKVDSDQLKEFFTSFFMGLVLTLVNDDSSECREHAAALIREILKRSNQEEIQTIEKLTLSWLLDDGPLCQGGMTVAGLFFAELGLKKSQQLYRSSIEKITEVLKSGKREEETTESDWKTIYASLQLFQKIVQLTGNSDEFQEIWTLVRENLLYPHSWVRLASSRLIGLQFSGYKEDDDLDAEELQSVALKLVRQLGAPEVSESLATQIVKNLVFIAMRWEKMESIYIPKQDDDEIENEDEDKRKLLAVDWLVNRASGILRNQLRPKEMKASKKAATQLMAALCQILSKERVTILAETLIMAYYNYTISEDERDKDLKDLCQEALNLIQNKIGTTEFVKAYSSVQETVASRRQERRTKRAIEAVVEPEKFAKKKLKKNLAKREKRRNAKDEYGQYHTKKKRAV